MFLKSFRIVLHICIRKFKKRNLERVLKKLFKSSFFYCKSFKIEVMWNRSLYNNTPLPKKYYIIIYINWIIVLYHLSACIKIFFINTNWNQSMRSFLTQTVNYSYKDSSYLLIATIWIRLNPLEIVLSRQLRIFQVSIIYLHYLALKLLLSVAEKVPFAKSDRSG
jgi:hypothetical protein